MPLALFLLEQGADPNVLDAGFTPLHWASGTWEGGISNPVYGFTDPMSGIPNRQQKVALVKALLAHGANPNARMTRRPPGFPGLGGGYEDAAGATPFLLASAAADLEMMRLLLAAGADPTQVTDTKATPVMAASGLNRGIGESPITEAQALEAVRFLFELGADAKGATTNGENALFGAAYRGWNTLLALLIDKGADVNAVSKAGVTPWLAASGLRRSSRRRPLQQGGRGHPAQTRRRSEARKAVSGAEQVPVMRRRLAMRRTLTTCACLAWMGAVCFQASQVRSGARNAGVSVADVDAGEPPLASPARALVTKYCVTCHNERLKTANLLLDKADADQIANSADTWEKVVVQLRSRAMPPVEHAAAGQRHV